jgi:hypothetical protein
MLEFRTPAAEPFMRLTKSIMFAIEHPAFTAMHFPFAAEHSAMRFKAAAASAELAHPLAGSKVMIGSLHPLSAVFAAAEFVLAKAAVMMVTVVLETPASRFFVFKPPVLKPAAARFFASETSLLMTALLHSMMLMGKPAEP